MTGVEWGTGARGRPSGGATKQEQTVSEAVQENADPGLDQGPDPEWAGEGGATPAGYGTETDEN